LTIHLEDVEKSGNSKTVRKYPAVNGKSEKGLSWGKISGWFRVFCFYMKLKY